MIIWYTCSYVVIPSPGLPNAYLGTMPTMPATAGYMHDWLLLSFINQADNSGSLQEFFCIRMDQYRINMYVQDSG